jgi:hypothetical protein
MVQEGEDVASLAALGAASVAAMVSTRVLAVAQLAMVVAAAVEQ